MGAAISMRVARLCVSARSQAAWASAIVRLWSLGHHGRNPRGPESDLLAGRRDPGDLDVMDADLTGEPSDPPDDRPGCFGARRGIAGLALDRDGGLIQLVPACRRPDQRAPAGKRYRVLERPPPLVGQRRIQLAITRTVSFYLRSCPGVPGRWPSAVGCGPLPGAGLAGPGSLRGPGRSWPSRRFPPSPATGGTPEDATQAARTATRTQLPSAPEVTLARRLSPCSASPAWQQVNRWAAGRPDDHRNRLKSGRSARRKRFHHRDRCTHMRRRGGRQVPRYRRACWPVPRPAFGGRSLHWHGTGDAR
jgi:hypothetical protein